MEVGTLIVLWATGSAILVGGADLVSRCLKKDINQVLRDHPAVAFLLFVWWAGISVSLALTYASVEGPPLPTWSLAALFALAGTIAGAGWAWKLAHFYYSRKDRLGKEVSSDEVA